MLRFAARLAVVVAASALTLLVPAVPAGAHAYLVTSSPGDGAVLTIAPQVLTLSFTESVELSATHIDIVDGDGRRFAPTSINTRSTGGGDAESPMDVVAGLPSLPANTYHVTWRTLSSDDLHATTGNLVIGIQRQVTAAARPPGPGGPAPLEALLRGLVLLGLSTALGGVAMALLARGGAGALRVALADVAVSGAVLAATAAPAQLWSQLSGVSGGLLWQQVTGGRWLLREAGLLGLAGGIVWIRRALRRRAAMSPTGTAAVAVAAVAAATGTELLGHAFGTTAFSLAVGSLHILAAGAWAGGVLAVAVAFVPALRAGTGRGPAIAGLLRGFAALAIACVTTLAVTGLLMTGAQVATVDALLTTPYGLLLVAKVVAVAVAGLLGLRTARRLRGQDGLSWRRLAAEATALALALGLAGALGSAGPARGPRFATSPALAVVPQSTGQTADLVDTLAVRPNVPGRNVITITVADTRRPALAPITGVSVILRSPEGAQTVHPVVRSADGGWAVTVDDITASGEWRVAVTVQRDGLAPVTDVHSWVVGSDTPPPPPTFSAAPMRPATTWLALVAGLAGLAGAGAEFWRRRRRASAPAAVLGTAAEPATGSGEREEKPLAGAAQT
ncbi:copper resistance protein CopC [Dactylosporangium sp. CA-139066]|uniref:copper resistance CopC family protein n=1 Tax=Dactylosporangium sp. CA-139066 TaxID=3239930 RepID=UPI003D91BAD8